MGVGLAAWRLGAGRARKEDPVSPSAGVVLRKVAGDRVEAGEVVLELHTEDPSTLDSAKAALADALTLGDGTPPTRPMVLDRIA